MIIIEKIGVSFWNWFNKTAAIYTVIILIGSAMGGNLSRRSIWGLALISGLMPLLENMFFSQFLRAIPHFSKLTIHYVACFVVYVIFSALIKINGISTWNSMDWLRAVIIYTIIYWGFNCFYMLKHNSEVKYLNNQLGKFKEKHHEN
ncbi:hypothetical protein [Clostridium sp.]|uniref:hypothetical protein n=1 Tax=Clostridium sp. TaxID=1506 RepID=UPI002FC814F1